MQPGAAGATSGASVPGQPHAIGLCCGPTPSCADPTPAAPRSHVKMAQVFDTLFGTRYYTEGATLQLPRKVPMRVEPKSYFGEPQTTAPKQQDASCS